MDPIRYGFIQTIIDFMETLPPLLQLMAGGFATIGIIKVMLMIANFIEAKREKKE
jgi:hypothetical protein